MRAMVVTQWGEPTDMRLMELPDPEPGPGQVAIDVRAISCNFFDILMIQGKYQIRPPCPFAPGGEVAGVVRAVGSGVQSVRPGDRVFALLAWGGYASVALAPAAAVVPLPADMPFEHGAGFGVVYLTSYLGLVNRAQLRTGETLLVHAAAGGVGLTAVQIGYALGARVLATAGSERKLAVARAHGAVAAFVYDGPDWVQGVKAATDGQGADIIYDPVGGDVFDLSLKCLAFGGRLLVVGFASGRIPSVQANRVLLKNIAIVGVTRGGFQQQAPAEVAAAIRALFALYERGAIHPVISATFPLLEAAAALEEIGSRRSVGKVLLIP